MKKSRFLSFVFTGILILFSGFSVARASTVAYTYAGPVFTAAGGATTADPLTPLYEGQSITGAFTTEELLPSTTTNFIGMLPSFFFSDGIRSINNSSIVPGPGDVSSPTADEFYVQSFTITTNSSGDISAWYISLINSSLVNALGTYQNGTGSDSTRLTPGLHDCIDGAYCGGSVSTNASGLTGTWTTSAVPVPASVWLFGSGLIGLIGVAKRKKAA